MADLRTLYDGPVVETELSFASVSVRIVRPSEPDRLLDDPEILALNRGDDYMPYWPYLWPGAFLLAEAIVRECWIGSESGIEIGCGLGLAGIMALRCGLGRLTFTDYDETPLRFVTASARLNGLTSERFTVRQLDWRRPTDERFDVLLAADVLYERRLVPLVADVISKVVKPAGQALVAGPYRVASAGFHDEVAARGLRVEEQEVTAVDDRGCEVRGTLQRVRWR
jgi:predicted nicotinamide N-methyase